MKILFRRLTADIHDDIIIYGTGYYAEKLYEKFKKFGMCDKVKAFAVTNEKDQKPFYGKDVYAVKNLREVYHGELILVAVSALYVEEIKGVLAEYQFENILYLTDYVQDDVFNAKEIISGKASGESYCQLAYEWAFEYYSTLYHDYETMRAYLKKREQEKKNRKQLVFIVGIENAMPRTVKIMAALKRRGYEVVLLGIGSADGSLVLDELEKDHIIFERCDSLGELMYKMLQYNPLLYYIELLGVWSWGGILIKQKDLFGTIVVSLYDVHNEFSQNEEIKSLEKYALENADGIVWRWYSEADLAKKMKLPIKNVHFLDYCRGKCEDESKGKEGPDDEVRLCIVAGFSNAWFEKPDGNSKWNRLAKMEEIMLKIGNDKKCQVHLFAKYINPENKKRCENLENQYDNFKAFWNYSHKKLLETIKDYDYGIQLMTGGEEIVDGQIDPDGHNSQLLKNAVANRHFDYLDAGLGIVTKGSTKKQCGELRQYNVIVDMDLSNLDVEHLRRNKKYYKENARKAREELSIDNQIGKLIDFFEDVAGE